MCRRDRVNCGEQNLSLLAMLYSAVNEPAQILPHTSYMVCSVVSDIFQELCSFDGWTVARQNVETV